jgi:hypothetical protein
VLDQPASSQALWNIYNATGIRPEFLIPVLSYESGLNPSVQNSQGAPYYGIGQNSAELIQQTGLTPAEYLTKPASFQLQNVVLPYFHSVVSKYGSLNSGVKVYQAEYMPASLQYAPGLDDVITKSPAIEYTSNVIFDKQRKGYITPRDLAVAVASQVPHPAVQKAISDAYAYAPSMGPPQDPVWGNTRGIHFTPKVTAAIALGIVGTAAAAAYLLAPDIFGLPAFAGARENPSTDLEERPSMRVQSLIFPRDRWTKAEARAWLKSHGYKSRSVDETSQSWRFRQEDPDQFDVLRTKAFGDNIKAVVGR